jgi:hypothetical protein
MFLFIQTYSIYTNLLYVLHNSKKSHVNIPKPYITPIFFLKHEWSWQTNKTNKLGPKVKNKINYLKTWTWLSKTISQDPTLTQRKEGEVLTQYDKGMRIDQ